MTYVNAVIREREIQPLIEKRNKIKKTIANIEERVKNTESCNICYSGIDNKTVLECCNNSFCYECIATWMNQNIKDARKPKCPICKELISNERLVIENKNKDIHKSMKNQTPRLDKPEQILKLLKEKDHLTSKILIFSENDSSFEIIIESLDNTKWKWNKIKGNTNVINSIVHRYKTTDEINILFINARNFGSGLNLENTTDIFIYHKLDKDLESQVIGRGQRLGRTSNLNVWNLVYPNE